MKMEILSVADRGNIGKERLLLEVRADTDIGDYVVLQSGFSEDSVTTNIYHAFWPPYKLVRAGDLIVIYTTSGKDNRKKLDNGKSAHFYYWGLEKPIWSTTGRAPIVLHAPKWTSKDPKEL